MGIKDLLKFMKPHTESVHIKKYAGKRVGIDAYSWLHKGAYSCSMEICLDSNSDKKLKYLDYFMHRINLLKHYKITPVVVFDGGSIPCKSATELERHRKREANRELAMEKLKEGNVTAASDLFQRAVSITPSMAHQLIEILKVEKIEFVVAPYEADAQLAYFSSIEAEKGGIAAVITEDSDLLAYGSRATIFKMDRYGNGEEIVMDRVMDARNCKPSFKNFNQKLFTGMCVLAGCDFLPSVPGIGIVKAHSYVSKYQNLDRVLSVLKLEKGAQMPEEYSKSFKETVEVFQHARIYDVNTKTLKHMKTLPTNMLETLELYDKLNFLGPEIPPSIATAIAEGKLNPITMEAFNTLTTSRRQPDGNATQNSSNLQSSKAATAFTDCQLAICACSSPRREGMSHMATMQDSSAFDRKYINEALQLQKLTTVPRNRRVEALPHKDITSKFPNNPFNKIKTLTQSVQENIIAEEASIVNEDDKSSANHATLKDVASKVLDAILSRKRKLDEVHFDQKNETTKPIHDGIGVANSDIKNDTKKPQKRVNFKPEGILNGKSRGKVDRSNNSPRLASENGTILKFFSRV